MVVSSVCRCQEPEMTGSMVVLITARVGLERLVKVFSCSVNGVYNGVKTVTG